MTLNSKFLYFIILSALIFQILKFYSFYSEYSAWQYVDWLINYQGGFVRRGLIGEFLFQIHSLLNLNLGLIIFIFVSFMYVWISFFLIKAVKYIHNSQLNTLIFLSPGFFLYPIMNSEVIGRKDILFLFVITFFTFLEQKIKDRNLLILLIFSIFFLCLSHSIFLFYSPYLFFLFILIKSSRMSKIKLYEVIIFLISLITIFLLIYFNQGNEKIVSEICRSIKDFVYSDCKFRGQMFWLGNDAKSHISAQNVNFSHFLIYGISLIFVYFFILLKFFKSKFKIKYLSLNKLNPITILIVLFLFTLPVYYLGSDWGRYISISFCGSFFIFIYCIKQKILTDNYVFKIKRIFFILLIFFYSFTWTFQFYHAEKIKFTLKKPLSQIWKKK